MSAKHQSYEYLITVQGHLDRRWKMLFEDLDIRHCSNGLTELKGVFLDQSALYGILNALSNIGVELVAVKRIKI